jgi:hypothetical protein
VDALTLSLGIEILADRQKGQVVGGSGSGSVDFTWSSPDHDTPLTLSRRGLSITAHPAAGFATTLSENLRGQFAGLAPPFAHDAKNLHTPLQSVQFGTAELVISHLS